MNRITTHPGDVLKEELEARGISQKKFSEVLNVPYTQLNEILNGKRPVTTDFALMMEAALGINPELLINMQSRYNMSVATSERLALQFSRKQPQGQNQSHRGNSFFDFSTANRVHTYGTVYQLFARECEPCFSGVLL